MTDEIFRAKMLELGWEHDEIDKKLIMHHLLLLYDIDNIPLNLSPRIVVTSYFGFMEETGEYARQLIKEHLRIFGYDVSEVCPKVKEILANLPVYENWYMLDNLEKALEKSISDKFDYLPRKYGYTADSKNQHIMKENEFRGKMKSDGWSVEFIDGFVKLHDIQQSEHNTEIPFNYYLIPHQSKNK